MEDISKVLMQKEEEVNKLKEDLVLIKNEVLDFKTRLSILENKTDNLECLMTEIRLKLIKIDNLELELNRVNAELIKINSGQLAQDITKTLIENQINQGNNILNNWKLLLFAIIILFASFLGVNVDKLIMLLR